MKTIRACMFLLAIAASANYVCMADAQGETRTKANEQRPTREVYGKIESIRGSLLTLRTRTGDIVKVNAKPAMEAYRSVPLVVGRAIIVKGGQDKQGVVQAETIQRAKESSAVWRADR